MSDLKLAHPPIVEAVVDLDCDMPVGFELTAIEARAAEAFSGFYPKLRRQMFQHHQIKASVAEAPQIDVTSGIQALQFVSADDRQLIQVRTGGYSFNRLAPYSSLDDYLPEIERTWRAFVDLALPVQVRRIALRTINRIHLPARDGALETRDYLKVGPRLADEKTLTLLSFLNQYTAIERETEHQVSVVMLTEQGKPDQLPIILDIEAFHPAAVDPRAWQNIHTTILSLRRLKDHVFGETLEPECLNLFQ